MIDSILPLELKWCALFMSLYILYIKLLYEIGQDLLDINNEPMEIKFWDISIPI